MSTLAPAPRADQCAPPPLVPVRHGVARLMLCINGEVYKLRRQAAPVRGARLWHLTKATGERAGAVYAVARGNCTVSCSCQDHLNTRAECKHIRALVACGLLARASVRSLAPCPKGGRS